MFAVCLSYMAFIRLRYVHSMPAFWSGVFFFLMKQILFSILSPNIKHRKSLQRIESALIKASLYQKKTENILLIQSILHLNDKLQ